MLYFTYSYPFFFDNHVLVCTLAVKQPFLEVVCAQPVGMLFIACDIGAFDKRVGRVDDDQFVILYLLLGCQFIIGCIRILILVEEQDILISLNALLTCWVVSVR